MINLWHIGGSITDSDYFGVRSTIFDVIAEYAGKYKTSDAIIRLLIPTRNNNVFASAIKYDNEELIWKLLNQTQSLSVMMDYIIITLKKRKVRYFDAILNQYLELGGDLKDALNRISRVDFGSYDHKTLVKMVLAISPDSNLKTFVTILRGESSKFIVEFALQTVDRFDWSKLNSLPDRVRRVVSEIINNQV